MPGLTDNVLPSIPSKRYFTIGEVAGLCDVKAHILRYWEQEFEQLSPVKRRGNRRYYRREDVLTIREIRRLLYEQGYTIGGARQILSSEISADDIEVDLKSHGEETSEQRLISQIIGELEVLAEFLDEASC